MTVNKDDEPYWEYDRGRWLCFNKGMASDCATAHPGDFVYTYERDSQGNMVNITEYWSPKMPDNNKMPFIKSGKLRWRD